MSWTPRRFVFVVFGVAASCVAIAVALLVTAWALGGDSQTVSGRVSSVEGAGGLVRVCVVDAGSARTLCGEIAPDRLSTNVGALVQGDCVRIKVARGAALEVNRAACR